MKSCSKCGVDKAESEFYTNRASADGFTSACRVCINADQKARRERLNASRPPDWKQKTADMAAYQREWLAKRPGYMASYMKKWYAKNKDRMIVKQRVRDAVRSGKMVKQPCHVCGELKVEAHHPDYSRPLDVVWLCKAHHREVHS